MKQPRRSRASPQIHLAGCGSFEKAELTRAFDNLKWNPTDAEDRVEIVGTSIIARRKTMSGRFFSKHERYDLMVRGLDSALRRRRKQEPFDFWPYVRIVARWKGASWLIAELDYDNPDRAFGLVDNGNGRAIIGTFSVAWIARQRGPNGEKTERDCHFWPRQSLDDYARDAAR